MCMLAWCATRDYRHPQLTRSISFLKHITPWQRHELSTWMRKWGVIGRVFDGAKLFLKRWVFRPDVKASDVNTVWRQSQKNSGHEKETDVLPNFPVWHKRQRWRKDKQRERLSIINKFFIKVFEMIILTTCQMDMGAQQRILEKENIIFYYKLVI